ncbi:symmetrical bis(5'-nucleosyl)-tetraphosphatase [Chromobacterium violaceum]|uniref:Bis(5'-nucleosyl)-tetraphosphatase, symmetrical n=2 Tax=Chromobacterium violaceum TaxID=536 RepID=APAH_CHRVO|nr:symmetrical bis(5'-nucleosyl)-tetraphosphatase [Chromobacterium violaceum]Q7NQS0.1 RecName: Full=Bis(5'-nucleosyl)-tetraphosphatase, symmetrical; AltName: Full=Ap4A hydrolase; AltName: Full=Diadenosine 5',5'''-P1,P4-tetraphosphate pyrophosphohydrolase; AltName: Full=Diadenosine tetraphosphatase [Chromobacterium violaceum ATCC 12472]AAQ61727.1 bis(5'-nucleosyl)-tetraphosphatase [Chromobacterium violaceum ATCC 12472]ATP30263.1 bis(5'-nucleosyl)-tetraphosphatase (symmetrical) [Chromobacterium vi
MAIYAIGDIQGCFEPFQQLLRLIDFNPGKDTLWLTGDLVNRGPQSLEVLRWVFQHQDQVEMVLGNHDLHLLAVSEGFGKIHRDDTIDDVLNAADGKVLLDWLRCQPMMLEGHGYAMVHAGLLPEWTISKALRLAEEVEFGLSGTRYREFLGRLYGNKPTRWTDDLKGVDRLRLIVNVMTRMRFLTRDGELDLSYKGELEGAPANLVPWFEAPNRRHGGTPIVCGHWSALGVHLDEDILAIDSGCLWGGSLSALRLDDKQLFSLPCQAYREIALATGR